MFKWMRRLIGMVIVLFILLVILLVPGSIPEGEQLRNVQAGSSLIELAQNAVSNASVSTEGLSTELKSQFCAIESGRKNKCWFCP